MKKRNNHLYLVFTQWLKLNIGSFNEWLTPYNKKITIFIRYLPNG